VYEVGERAMAIPLAVPKILLCDSTAVELFERAGGYSVTLLGPMQLLGSLEIFRLPANGTKSAIQSQNTAGLGAAWFSFPDNRPNPVSSDCARLPRVRGYL